MRPPPFLRAWTQITHTALPHDPHNYTDPFAIIPLYSSVFNDAWRLVFCLLGHPVLLEICLFSMREIKSPAKLERWDTGGREAHAATAGATAFTIEAILVLDRRFLIG